MTHPVPDKKVFILTCTRAGDAAAKAEHFRVAATDAEHAVQIAKRQGLTVVEFHLEAAEHGPIAAVEAAGGVYAVAPEASAGRPQPSAKPTGAKRPDWPPKRSAPTTAHTPVRKPTLKRAIVGGGVVVGVLALIITAASLAVIAARSRPRPRTNLSAAGAPAPSDDWYAGSFESASPSCVTIRTRFGNGSGFAVKPYLICTNAHVVRGDSRRTMTVVQPESGQTASVIGVIHFDAYHDIALIAVDRPFPVLDIALGGPPPPGESLLAIGSPGLNATTTLENSVSRLLAAKTVGINHTTMLQLNGSVNPGNSGGPLLNRGNIVVGMVTAKARDKDGIGFAVLARDIREAVEGSERSTPEMRVAADQRHAAAALVHRVVYARGYEFSLLQEWDRVVDTISNKSERVGHALSAIRAEWETKPEVIAMRDRIRDDSITADLAQLEKDGVGYDVIAAVRAFDIAVQDMATFAKYPRGSPTQLREQITRHRESVAAATAHVCEKLDLPAPDWDEVLE